MHDIPESVPGMILIESDDTAGSARQISENKLKGVAAIASSNAAEIYGLEILAPGIETYKQNYTRFLVVGSEDKGNKKEIRFQSAFQQVINPDHWQKYLSNLQNLKLIFQKSNRFRG